MDDGGAFTSNMDTRADGFSGQPITFSVAPGDRITWNGQSGDLINIKHQYITIDCDDRMTMNIAGGGTIEIIQTAGGSSAKDDADYFKLQSCTLVGAGYNTNGSSKCLYLQDDNFTITDQDDFFPVS